MSTYNPAILTVVNGNAFNGAQVDAAFDDLSTAINGNVDATSNVVDNNILPYNKFHAGAVTETWTASSRGQGNESFLVVMEDSTATSSPWGAGQNFYDVRWVEHNECCEAGLLLHGFSRCRQGRKLRHPKVSDLELCAGQQRPFVV